MARIDRMSNARHRISAQARQKAARTLGLNEQYLYQLLTKRSRAPLERCAAIEQAFGGSITCEQMRPDVTWHRIPDPTWPHPAGRPVIDVARPVVAEAQEV